MRRGLGLEKGIERRGESGGLVVAGMIVSMRLMWVWSYEEWYSLFGLGF